MLVAAAAVGVATVFAAPFSGETLPRTPPCTLHPPIHPLLLWTHLLTHSSVRLRDLEEGWGAAEVSQQT